MMKRPVLLVMLCTALTACTSISFPGSSQPQACVVRVGIINSNSGAFSAAGLDLMRGYEMARDDLNMRGGVPLTENCPVELVVRDDQSDVAQAKSATQSLVREPVIAILGSTSTDLTMPMASVANAAHIPVIPPTASNDVLTAAYEYAVRLAADQSQMVRAQFDYLSALSQTINSENNQLPPLSVGVLTEASESGHGIFSAVERAARDHGFALVAAEDYASGASDWSTPLEYIRRAHPDVLYLDTNHVDQMNLLLGQARNLVPQPQLIIVSTLPDALVANKLTERVLTSVQWLPSMDWHAASGETTTSWTSRFEQRYGVAPNVRNVAAYESLNMVTMALQDTISMSALLSNLDYLRPALLRTLYSTRVDSTLFGPIEFDEFGQNKHPVTVVQVQNAKSVMVWPREVLK